MRRRRLPLALAARVCRLLTAGQEALDSAKRSPNWNTTELPGNGRKHLSPDLDWKRQEVAPRPETLPLVELRHLLDPAATRGLRQALQAQPDQARGSLRNQKASPSAGLIRADFDPVAIAEIYECHGAAAISVLTDTSFLQGELRFLTAVRQHCRCHCCARICR